MVTTTRSAYQIQFDGTFSKLKLTPIWKALAEAKCHVFAWTLLHNKQSISSNGIDQMIQYVNFAK